jgi:hypothetical protein
LLEDFGQIGKKLFRLPKNFLDTSNSPHSLTCGKSKLVATILELLSYMKASMLAKTILELLKNTRGVILGF